MNMMKKYFIVIGFLLLAACSSPIINEDPVEEYGLELEACRRGGQEDLRLFHQDGQEILKQRVLDALTYRMDKELDAARPSADIVVLSGGGRNFAWGCGLIKGWRGHADHPRPNRPAVVTGVSAGSLYATHFFLGTEEDDEALHSAVKEVDNSKIYEESSLVASLLYGNALKPTVPFKGFMRQYIDHEIMQRVADELENNGRRLFVASVSLPSGQLVIWDMTEIACLAAHAPDQRKQEGYLELYLEVLLASSAVPAILSPRVIDGVIHVDGGAREQLFLRSTLLPCLQAVADGSAVCPPVRVHVIVNGPLGVQTKPEIENRLLPVGLRSLQLLMDEALVGNLYRIKAIIQEFDAANASFHLSVMPADLIVPGDGHDFNPKDMLRLYDNGLGWGQRGTWHKEIPEQPTQGPIPGIATP